MTAVVQTRDDAVEVPLQVDVPGPQHFVSIRRSPGLPPSYSAQIIGAGYIRISPDPERAGPSRLRIDVFTIFEDFFDVDDLVLTTAAGTGRAAQRSVRRTAAGRYVADIRLARGENTIAVIARDRQGARLRAVFALDVPG